MNILNNQPSSAEQNTIARVSYSNLSGFGVVGASELRNPVIFAPGGISYLPAAGDNILLLQALGAGVCVGTASSTFGLMPGELRLTSSGGATIRLRANGSVEINGRVFTSTGQFL